MRLNYDALKQYDGYLLRQAPERVLQFGEGNFLRAFVDDFFDIANEVCGFDGKIVICQPIPQGLTDRINEQEGLYTLYLRGFQNGQQVNEKRIISAVSRCINPYEDFDALLSCAENPDLRFLVSNTTEAGIAFDPACRLEDAPPASFPGKLTRFLYERYRRLGGAKGTGFVILSCELIDNNGKELQRCVRQYIDLWQLEADFARWVEEENLFCSTLVDRIVTGYPKNEAAALNAENGYEDALLDTGEVFGFWVIEGPDWLKEELPFERAGLPVLVTGDHSPYKKRKVRILNGAHTSMVPAAFLAGQDIVRSCMEDPVISAFMDRTIQKEIIPVLPLPKEELETFAGAVKERFRNPFIDHALLSICLNSTSKWKARCLPSLEEYLEQFGRLPENLTFSLAAYLALYSCDIRALDEQGLHGRRPSGEDYVLRDDGPVLRFFFDHRGDSPEALTAAALSSADLWGRDLTEIPGLEAQTARYLKEIREKGTYRVMEELNCL